MKDIAVKLAQATKLPIEKCYTDEDAHLYFGHPERYRNTIQPTYSLYVTDFGQGFVVEVNKLNHGAQSGSRRRKGLEGATLEEVVAFVSATVAKAGGVFAEYAQLNELVHADERAR